MGQRQPVSLEEETLIQQIRATYPGDDGDQLAAALRDGSVVGTKSSNPRVQALLDRLDRIRVPRMDSLAKAAEARMRASKPIYPATLAIASDFPEPGAIAIVVRRTRLQPPDIIMLREGRVTPGAYRAAIQALVDQRRKDGVVPSLHL